MLSLSGPDGVYQGSAPDPDCQGQDKHFRTNMVRRICDGWNMGNAADDAADDAELLDADGCDADSNLHWGSADDAEQRDDAAGDAEPQAESDDAADDARNAEPDGDDSQARDDCQATLHLMSPVPADDAELN